MMVGIQGPNCPNSQQNTPWSVLVAATLLAAEAGGVDRLHFLGQEICRKQQHINKDIGLDGENAENRAAKQCSAD